MKSLEVYYWYVMILLIYQNATVRVCGARIRVYYVLCSKIYRTLGSLFLTPAGSRRAAWGTRICEIRLSYHVQ